MDEIDWTNKSLHNKLEHVIGRLDVFQNKLESQNQKQTALDEKLVELKTQFEKEKSFSREPQNETQTIGLSPVKKAKFYDSGQVSPQPIYNIPFLSDIIKEVRYKLKVVEQNTDLMQNVLAFSENMKTLMIELELINTSITSLARRLGKMETSLATVVQKMDSVETSMNDENQTVKEDLKKNMATVVPNIDSPKTSLFDGHKTVKENLLPLKQWQDLMTTRVEQPTNEVKDKIYRSKREIFAVTENEAQIVRDRREGPLPSLRKYTFDFYVWNFKTLARSGNRVHSKPWHIDESKKRMAGLVWFEAGGNINVLFINPRRPRKVGLRPARNLKVKATICDVDKKVLPDIVLGEVTWDTDKAPISRHNGDRSWSLGVTSCDDLINKGYGEKEGYQWRAILIRYDVTVL